MDKLLTPSLPVYPPLIYIEILELLLNRNGRPGVFLRPFLAPIDSILLLASYDGAGDEGG